MAGSARTIVRLRPGRTRRRRGGSRARLLAASIAAPLALLLGPGGAGAAITEFPVPTADSLPAGIAAGPDGALWFTESAFSVDPGRIGRITTTGTIGEVPVPPTGIPTRPFAITPGPDGALWFTQPGQFRGGGQIGRITTAGAISEFFGGSAPEDIAAGPDGALWVTDPANGAIDRITTGGAFSAIGVGFPFSRPSGIAAGPDGALWYTDPGTDVIGRVTTAGAVTTYPLPTRGSGPSGITSGPDGALWFTEADAGAIGRITTAGVVRAEFPTPTPGSRPAGITTGPDGALWFTEASGNRIGRITTAGAAAEFPVPTPASRPDRDRRRPRRRALVHRGVRQQDRADRRGPHVEGAVPERWLAHLPGLQEPGSVRRVRRAWVAERPRRVPRAAA